MGGFHICHLCVGDPGSLWGQNDKQTAGDLIARFPSSRRAVAIVSNIIDIAPFGAGDGLLIIGDGKEPLVSAALALLGLLKEQQHSP